MKTIYATASVGIAELRDSITHVLKHAEELDEAVAILNRNKPAGYIISTRMMESMLDAVAGHIAKDRTRTRLESLDQARKVTLNEL